MEGSKVSETRRIPAFFDELYRIQDKNHGYGKDGEDGDHDQEFYESEALGSFGGHIKYPDTEADLGHRQRAWGRTPLRPLSLPENPDALG